MPKIHQLGRSSPRRIQWYNNSSNKTQHGPPPLSKTSLHTRKWKGTVFETAFQGIFRWRLQSDMWLGILVALRCFSLVVSPSLRMTVSEGFLKSWETETVCSSSNHAKGFEHKVFYSHAFSWEEDVSDFKTHRGICFAIQSLLPNNTVTYCCCVHLITSRAPESVGSVFTCNRLKKNLATNSAKKIAHNWGRS